MCVRAQTERETLATLSVFLKGAFWLETTKAMRRLSLALCAVLGLIVGASAFPTAEDEALIGWFSSVGGSIDQASASAYLSYYYLL